jgi:hypothetical protein
MRCCQSGITKYNRYKLSFTRSLATFRLPEGLAVIASSLFVDGRVVSVDGRVVSEEGEPQPKPTANSKAMQINKDCKFFIFFDSEPARRFYHEAANGGVDVGKNTRKPT